MGSCERASSLAHVKSLMEESLALCREVGDRVNLNWLLHDLGGVEMHRRNYSRAEKLMQESLNIAQQLDHKQGMSQSLQSEAAGTSGEAPRGDPGSFFSGTSGVS
jgi:hypothetical protein